MGEALGKYYQFLIPKKLFTPLLIKSITISLSIFKITVNRIIIGSDFGGELYPKGTTNHCG